MYRIFSWIRSFFHDKVLCQLCGLNKSYKDSGIIKVKYENGAIMDLVICGNCADQLEQSKHNYGKSV